MTNKLKNIRGMNDILPNISSTYRYIESILGKIVSSYGYSEIRLPLLEHTELFKRSALFKIGPNGFNPVI